MRVQPYPLVSGDAAFREPQPQPRVGVIHLHRLHQTLERCQRPPDVQQLNPAVVQQLVALGRQQRTHGDARELFS